MVLVSRGRQHIFCKRCVAVPECWSDEQFLALSRGMSMLVVGTVQLHFFGVLLLRTPVGLRGLAALANRLRCLYVGC